MTIKRTLLGLSIGIVLVSQTGCSKKEIENPDVIEAISTETGSEEDLENDVKSDGSASSSDHATIVIEDDTAIMERFESLASEEDNQIAVIMKYIKNNISMVSPENAGLMLTRLEEMQVSYRAQLEDKYISDTIQQGFQNAFLEKVDYSKPDDITDALLKELVQDTVDSGFVIEQAEGFFYPMIDYSVYLDYHANALPELTDYYEIMAVESNQVFAKDAALVIGWDEVIKRALAQEEYIIKYPNSDKTASVNELYQRYVRIAFYGLNNTPLFDYETKLIVKEAEMVYQTFLKDDVGSQLLMKMKDFLAILEKSQGKLSKEVEMFREELDRIVEPVAGKVKSDRYSVAGIEDAAEFEKTFRLLQDLVRTGDKKTFSEYIAYPITVNLDGSRTEIIDEEQFVKNYDKIMTQGVKDVLLNQVVEETFVNYKGVMAGDGELWFNRLDGTKHIYSIYGINN